MVEDERRARDERARASGRNVRRTERREGELGLAGRGAEDRRLATVMRPRAPGKATVLCGVANWRCGGTRYDCDGHGIGNGRGTTDRRQMRSGSAELRSSVKASLNSSLTPR